MKKRLLFAALLSVAAGGMFYQVSWSEDIPVEAPGQDVEDPRVFTGAYCEQFPLDLNCLVPTAQEIPRADAPGQDIEQGPQTGFCIQFPGRPECDKLPEEIEVPPPVEAPGQEVDLIP